MKKEVLVFLSENYADWEGGYICSELQNPESGFIVKTVAITDHPIKSMGGFTVIPDGTIDKISSHFEMLILIGGKSWMEGKNERVLPLIEFCREKKIPIAAICGACTFLAEKGYLDHIDHTGNSAAYLEQFAPHYKGRKNFIEKQVVSSNGIITANGTAAVEFTKEILKQLEVMPQEKLEQWYQIFKVGFYQQ